MTTPLLGTSEIAEGVANQVPTHNLALRQLEARTIRALSMITMAPPAAVEGDSYIIPAGATGAWAGKAGQIAAFIGGAWSYLVPIEGIRLWINDLDAEYVYDGAAWVANGGGGAEDAIAAHVAETDPHPQYLTQSEADLLYAAGGDGSTQIAAHVAAADPHAQYQKESEKGAANGYASLGADGKVPSAQLPATTAQPFDVTAFYPGVLTASAIVTRVPVARAVTFPAGLTGSIATASVAATASAAFSVQKNGVSAGTITFAAGATSGTFAAASAITLAAGDILSISAPGAADATLANVGIVLAGTR
jgi:hypothetical protein